VGWFLGSVSTAERRAIRRWRNRCGEFQRQGRSSTRRSAEESEFGNQRHGNSIGVRAYRYRARIVEFHALVSDRSPPPMPGAAFFLRPLATGNSHTSIPPPPRSRASLPCSRSQGNHPRHLRHPRRDKKRDGSTTPARCAVVERLFTARFTGRLPGILTLIFYPAEVTAHLEKNHSPIRGTFALTQANARLQSNSSARSPPRYSLSAPGRIPAGVRLAPGRLLFSPTTDRGQRFRRSHHR